MMMMDFFEVLKEGQKDFCNLIINEQDVAVRTCKKVEYTSSKLYENKRRALRSHQRHHHNVQGDQFWFGYPRAASH